MGAVGGGKHGSAFLSETKQKKKKTTSLQPPLVPVRLFHPSIPLGAGAGGGCRVPSAAGEPWGDSMPPQPGTPVRQRWALATEPAHPRQGRAVRGCWWGMQSTHRAVAEVGGSPRCWGALGYCWGYCCRVSGPLGPELTLSFLLLEGKCVARGTGDLLPPPLMPAYQT